MNNKKIKIIKKHPPMAQHVPGDAQVPTMELHFKRLNERLVIIDMVCVHVGSHLFSKLIRPTAFAARNLR
jgi:hypothetical protein